MLHRIDRIIAEGGNPDQDEELARLKRALAELNTVTQAAIDVVKPVRRPVLTKLTSLSTLLIESNTVGTTTASPAPEFIELLTQVPI